MVEIFLVFLACASHLWSFHFYAFCGSCCSVNVLPEAALHSWQNVCPVQTRHPEVDAGRQEEEGEADALQGHCDSAGAQHLQLHVPGPDRRRQGKQGTQTALWYLWGERKDRLAVSLCVVGLLLHPYQSVQCVAFELLLVGFILCWLFVELRRMFSVSVYIMWVVTIWATGLVQIFMGWGRGG